MESPNTYTVPVAEVIPPGPSPLPLSQKPWYHETPTPQLFNEWTWTHFAWGMVSAGLIPTWWQALLLHTLYEAVEGKIFPNPNRDVSMRNHVGDSVAFMVGRWAIQVGGRGIR